MNNILIKYKANSKERIQNFWNFMPIDSLSFKKTTMLKLNIYFLFQKGHSAEIQNCTLLKI